MAGPVRRYGLPLTLLMAALVASWILVTIVLPEILMMNLSFRRALLAADLGGPRDHYSLANYATLLKTPSHLLVFLQTILGSVLVTGICLLVCYPVAYCLAQGTPRARLPVLVLLLIVPLGIGEVLRAFVWLVVLARPGPLDGLLGLLGIPHTPTHWLPGAGGIVVGMIYAFVLFMLLPLYGGLATLDRSQVEAARDLGAGTLRIHRRIVLPHARPGIALGCILVLTLAAGSYAVPFVLGSPHPRWLALLVYRWISEGENWPQGAAYAFLLLLCCMGFAAALMRLLRVGPADIAS